MHWYTHTHTTKVFTGFFPLFGGGGCIALVTARLWVVLKPTMSNFFTKHILRNLLFFLAMGYSAPMHAQQEPQGSGWYSLLIFPNTD